MSVVRARRWTRAEYDRLVDVGLLHPDEPVELIEGEIVEMPPQHGQHATAIVLAQEALRAVFGHGFVVRVQLPLALGAYSEPEPDLAVVAGSPRDHVAEHPSSAVLVVEVADATLTFDRETKGSLYAKAGIPEYWLVNVVHRQVEVYRDPGPMPEAVYGSGYRSRTVAVPGDTISVLARPGAQVAVADLLP
ncbi:MAG TPA: Uma2 family endonuclease [Chloroflexota bacterium]